MAQTIMIVDDEQNTLGMLKEILSSEGYKVLLANNGEDCLNQIRKGATPNLILLDIMMPKLNGWDVAATIKKSSDFKNVPIIFLTAKSDQTSRELARFTSSDYIEKPFEIGNLLEKIRKVI